MFYKFCAFDIPLPTALIKTVRNERFQGSRALRECQQARVHGFVVHQLCNSISEELDTEMWGGFLLNCFSALRRVWVIKEPTDYTLDQLVDAVRRTFERQDLEVVVDTFGSING